ncbi:MAG: phosphoribosylformylglycinamidine synthase I [Planctomycetaceae bacterium]
MKPSVLVLRAAGTNCDRETAHAFLRAGGAPESLHVNALLARPELLLRRRILVLPGGFSYGDDIAAGRVLATELRERVVPVLGRFLEAGGLVLGICNGFQVLVKTGLLPGPAPAGQTASLVHNATHRYEDRWVELEAGATRCPLVRAGERFFFPIAHAEGRFVARDETLDALERAGQVVLRYRSNPNGSFRSIAGVCDASGRVIGLMPHPERHLEPWHHPFWTRAGLAEETDGMRFFRRAVDAAS